MARGTRGRWGAEWGEYHKERQSHQWKVEERKKERPAVYLLVKIETDSVSYVVKVGQTSRNALQRLEEQKAKGYELLAHWRIRDDWLLQCESQILQVFKAKYGSPVEGREAFRVKSKACALATAEAEITRFLESVSGAESQI